MNHLKKIQAASADREVADARARKATATLSSLIVAAYEAGEGVTAIRRAAGYKTATAVYKVLYKAGYSGEKGKRMTVAK